MIRPLILAALGLSIVCLSPVAAADKKYGPGVTDTEIRIGQTMPYSGPLSSLSRFMVITGTLKMSRMTGMSENR